MSQEFIWVFSFVFGGSYSGNSSVPSQAHSVERQVGHLEPYVTVEAMEVQDPAVVRVNPASLPPCLWQASSTVWFWEVLLEAEPQACSSSPTKIFGSHLSLLLIQLTQVDVVIYKSILTETMDILLSHRREILLGWLSWISCVGIEQDKAIDAICFTLHSTRVWLTHSHII